MIHDGGADIYDIETRTFEKQDTAVVRRRMAVSELTSWLSGVYGTVALHLQRIGVTAVGQPFARYHARDGHVDVEAGLPTAERITTKDAVKSSSLPAGPAAVTWHRGTPDELEQAFEALQAWMERTGVEPVGAPWAIHHINPIELPEDNSWTTEVVQPIRD